MNIDIDFNDPDFKNVNDAFMLACESKGINERDYHPMQMMLWGMIKHGNTKLARNALNEYFDCHDDSNETLITGKGWYFVEFGSVADANTFIPKNKRRVNYPKIGFEPMTIYHRSVYDNSFCNFKTGCTTLIHDDDDVLAVLKMSEIECGVAGRYDDTEKDVIVKQFSKLNKLWQRGKGYDKTMNVNLERTAALVRDKIEWHSAGETWQ